MKNTINPVSKEKQQVIFKALDDRIITLEEVSMGVASRVVNITAGEIYDTKLTCAQIHKIIPPNTHITQKELEKLKKMSGYFEAVARFKNIENKVCEMNNIKYLKNKDTLYEIVNEINGTYICFNPLISTYSVFSYDGDDFCPVLTDIESIEETPVKDWYRVIEKNIKGNDGEKEYSYGYYYINSDKNSQEIKKTKYLWAGLSKKIYPLVEFGDVVYFYTPGGNLRLSDGQTDGQTDGQKLDEYIDGATNTRQIILQNGKKLLHISQIDFANIQSFESLFDVDNKKYLLEKKSKIEVDETSNKVSYLEEKINLPFLSDYINSLIFDKKELDLN